MASAWQRRNAYTLSLQCYQVCIKRWIWSNKITDTSKYWYYFLAIEANNNCILESWSLLLEKLFVISDFNTVPLCYIAPLKVTIMSLTALMENCTLLKQCWVEGDQGIRSISSIGRQGQKYSRFAERTSYKKQQENERFPTVPSYEEYTAGEWKISFYCSHGWPKM